MASVGKFIEKTINYLYIWRLSQAECLTASGCKFMEKNKLLICISEGCNRQNVAQLLLANVKREQITGLYILKQQNRHHSVIISHVCEYFSFIRSFTWLNFQSESNSYHKTSLSMSFGCWYLSRIRLFPLNFAVYEIAWQRKFIL